MMTAYFGFALIAAMVGVVSATLFNERATVRQRAEQQERNLAIATQGEIARMVSVLDLALQTAAQAMMTPGLAEMEPNVRQHILFSAAKPLASPGIFIMDDQGRVIYASSNPKLLDLNLGDRPYVQAHRAQPELGLVISPPIHSRSDGTWIIGLSRRFNHPDGSFGGLVLGRIELDAFQSLFDRFDISPQAIINLVSTDGRLLARRPRLENDRGRDLADSPMFGLLKQAPTGSFETNASLDSVPRLYTYRKVDDLPFVVGVGFATSEIYADWTMRTEVVGGVLVLLVLFYLGAKWRWLKELHRKNQADAANHALQLLHQEALSRLDTFFHCAPDMMVILGVTPNGHLVYEDVNPVWESVTGLTKSAAIGRGPENCLPPEVSAFLLSQYRHCIDTGRAAKFAFQTKFSTGCRDWDTLAVPAYGPNGEINRIVVVGRDVTERNFLEAGLRHSQRLEAVGQLTAGVAHDFNNLLQVISGALEVLQNEPQLTRRGVGCANLIERATSRGSTLTHRLLAFARKQALHPQDLAPEAVVIGVTALLESLLGDHVGVEIDIDAGAWTVHADGAQLENCLVNLVLNGRDAMPNGGVIRILVRNEATHVAQQGNLSAGEYVRFSVEDTGNGMDDETMSRALEPFFTTKPVGQGTGLGLSMVQGFARQSGGDVRIESVVGRGTTVSLWLPRAAAASAVSVPAMQNTLGLSGDGSRVLLVDDEAEVRETLTLFLSEAGYAPLAVESGDAALALLRNGELYDLLVTDQSMPGLKGSTLIQEAACLRPNMPSLLITGYDRVSGLDGLDVKVTVLRKPFRREAFLLQVQGLLEAASRCPPTENAKPKLVFSRFDAAS
jgi:PAS domain S-box-containing protein